MFNRITDHGYNYVWEEIPIALIRKNINIIKGENSNLRKTIIHDALKSFPECLSELIMSYDYNFNNMIAFNFNLGVEGRIEILDKDRMAIISDNKLIICNIRTGELIEFTNLNHIFFRWN